MDEFSLYVLDITKNSVRAGADCVSITLKEEGEWLDFTVSDNGCGMTEEQVKRLQDPFFTTRKKITSVHESVSKEHGTTTFARFGRRHIDFIPLGDLVGTVTTLIQGSPHIDFIYDHHTEKGSVHLSCAELRAVLGGEISLAEPEILSWIDGYLREQYQALDLI